MGLNVKELKNDVLIDIKVNKNFYLMVKSLSYYLFQTVKDDKEREESLKKIMSGKYEEMNDFERSFYTTTLILAEIERVAKEQNLYEEKQILEPDDEGYVEPTQG
jgi:hypothetical protein